MKHQSTSLAFTFLALTAACHGHHSDDDDYSGSSIPVFFEVENNDDAFNPNDFGVLRPGDHFVIEGHITDNGFDPFDGFLFTAGEPIHVDFDLFIDNAFADLDVCLYDPVFDEIVDCWQTASNPEQGGVDAVSGGVDFHLVVESFTGSSTYGLEIRVFDLPAPITAASSATGQPAKELLGVGATPEGTKQGTDRSSFDAYANSRESSARIEIEQEIQIDLESGFVIETIVVDRVSEAEETAEE